MEKKILLVDDEAFFIRVLNANLKINNYTCISAGNGMEALEILEKSSEDIFLIITDLMMPIMDGMEFIKVARVKYPMIEIILLTGAKEANKSLELLNIGISAYICKPIEMAELIFLTKKAEEIFAIKTQNKKFLERFYDENNSNVEKNAFIAIFSELNNELEKQTENNFQLIEYIKKNFNPDDLPEDIKKIIDGGDDYALVL